MLLWKVLLCKHWAALGQLWHSCYEKYSFAYGRPVFAQLYIERANIATQNRPWSDVSLLPFTALLILILCSLCRYRSIVYHQSVCVLMYFCRSLLFTCTAGTWTDWSSAKSTQIRQICQQSGQHCSKNTHRGFSSRCRAHWVYDSNSRGSKHCNDTLTVPMKCHFTTRNINMTFLKEFQSSKQFNA